MIKTCILNEMQLSVYHVKRVKAYPLRILYFFFKLAKFASTRIEEILTTVANLYRGLHSMWLYAKHGAGYLTALELE